VLDNKLIVIGGYRLLADQDVDIDIVFELDEHASRACQGKWRAHAARLHTARAQVAAITFNGKIFMCGGSDAASDLQSVESFNPDAGAWQVEEDMTKVRFDFSLFIFEELYAVGGDGGDQNTTIEKRNKATSNGSMLPIAAKNGMRVPLHS